LPSFESTIAEIEAQNTDIPSYISDLNSQVFDEVSQENSVFVGAGDSLCSAMWIERLHNFKPRALDPNDLFRNPVVSQGKVTHFISVSGRTKSNIEAATAVGGIARRKIALTASPQSLLAKCCSKTIQLKFEKSSGLTPGTNSFTASLLACYRIFAKIPEQINLGQMFSHAKKWAQSQSENAVAVHFVASGHLFPIAMYGAAKVFEFTGCKADYQITEEFSHMNLFSLDKRDLILILRGEQNDSNALKLADELQDAGYYAQVLNLTEHASQPLHIAISGAIHMQHFALNMALRMGLAQPAFLENEKLLGISNKMIYFD